MTIKHEGRWYRILMGNEYCKNLDLDDDCLFVLRETWYSKLINKCKRGDAAKEISK